MLRPSPNHGTQRLPNDDDDEQFEIPPEAIEEKLRPEVCDQRLIYLRRIYT